jgi:hypothetical protein
MRPEHPDASVHRPETNAVSPTRDERRQLIDRTINLWPPVVHFRRTIVITRVRRLALAIGSQRLIKPGPRTSKIVEDLKHDSGSRRGHSPRSTIKKT